MMMLSKAATQYTYKMPNIKGGKNYKKSKNTTAGADPIFSEAVDDQQYGRIVRNLGNSNMLVYCTDNKRRICHIRGGIRKKMWLNIGDIVVVSIRDFVTTEIGEFERGDILTKCDPSTFGQLKKLPGFNLRLFMDLEKLSDTSDAWSSTHTGVAVADEDIFEHGDSRAAAPDADIDIDAI